MWGTGDWSHGWGGTPLIQMSEHVLGISAASPGFQKVMLAPIPLGLTFARGSVPTSHGDIKVSWEKEKSRFSYNVVLPASTMGTLDLTGVERVLGASVSIDGHRPTIYRGPLAIAAGSHSVVLTFTH